MKQLQNFVQSGQAAQSAVDEQIAKARPLERPVKIWPDTALGLLNSTLDVIATFRAAHRLHAIQCSQTERDTIADSLEQVGRCCYTLALDVRKGAKL